ncbi:DUF1269 domain-containing protein [Occultella glacieicola]|uniref:DUF1269 domain-containing protein n=1 Tax=Occultella glacieicola TaxID=2518684 RepID=A0ABY2E8N1_9MICO|nr:DUF1269 domain-containing protein [Occultella glacieicola]TDE97347.1 DUF1269 domain-containing protein [Occultella glacieicola]
MTTFTAWKFDSIDGADRAADTLKQVRSEGLVKVEDHAVLTWPADADRPDVKYEHRDDARAAGWGAFWGVLFGALFFLPLIGAAAGAAISLLNKRMNNVGITREQLERIGKEVGPGNSALFVVTSDRDLDRMAERFRGHEATLIATNLVAAEAAELRQAFDA